MAENIYNQDFVRELFDRMSASYERMNYITSFGFSSRWRAQFLRSLPASEAGLEIMDLLTGMGETWPALKRRFPNSRITALDFSAGMLQYANAKNEARFDNEICVLQQNVLQNHLPDEYFDIVICAFGLKTFNNEQLRILARETGRILKPGGHFSFVDVSSPDNAVLRSLYGFYLGRIIPVLGRILLGNPVEYRMLWKYASSFGNAEAAAKIFEDAGLQIQYQSYFYACATGFSGRKQL